jgi:hypothetical protein
MQAGGESAGFFHARVTLEKLILFSIGKFEIRSSRR